MAEEILVSRSVESASSATAKRGPEHPSRFARLATGLIENEALIYAGCVLAAMVPLVFVDRFPSQDGPAHLYVAFLLQDFWNGASDEVLQHFMLNKHLEPNYFVYSLLYLLIDIFPILVAEKLFIGAAFVGLAVAARYAVTFHSTDDAPFAFLFLPFGFGLYLHLGFYNFFLGTVFYIAIVGFLLRRRKDSGIAMLSIVALLSLLMVVTHLFAWAVLLLTLAGIRAGDAFAQVASKSRTPAAACKALVVDGLKFVLAAFPSIVIAVNFFLRYSGGESGKEAAESGLRLVFNVLAISPVHAVSAGTAVTAIPYLVLVWTLVAAAIMGVGKKSRKFVLGGAFWLPLALLGGIYFGPHLGFKDFSAQERLLPFGFSLLFLLIAYYGVNRAMKATIVAVVAATILIGTVQRGLFYADIDDLLDVYLEQMSEIEPRAVIFAPQMTIRRDVVDGTSLGLRVNLMQHASTILAMNHDAVDLSVSLLSRARYGYFPVYYRDEEDLYNVLQQVDDDRASAVFADLDYVIFWPKEPHRAATREGEGSVFNMLGHLRETFTRFAPSVGGPVIYCNQNTVSCEGFRARVESGRAEENCLDEYQPLHPDKGNVSTTPKPVMSVLVPAVDDEARIGELALNSSDKREKAGNTCDGGSHED